MTSIMQTMRDKIAAWWLGQGGAALAKTGAKVDPWRFQPVGPADIFTRALALHFPVWKRVARLPASRLHLSGPAGVGSAVALQRGVSGDFSGFSVYQPGDDPRQIDWRATARTRQPMTRQWEGESQQPVVIVVDVSASLWFEQLQQREPRPIDQAFEMAVLIAAAALARQMPVDVLLVSDRVELHLKHLLGRGRLGQLMQELAAFRPTGLKTDWSAVAGSLHTTRPGAWLFWVSDFLWLPHPDELSQNFRHFQPIGICVRKSGGVIYDDQAACYDIETGEPINHLQANSGEMAARRLQRWSVESQWPIFPFPALASRPELLLMQWLTGGMNRK